MTRRTAERTRHESQEESFTIARRKDAQDELVLSHLPVAYKVARKLLKQWGAWLERAELESLCALALCEAATRYRSEEGTTFLSYSFYFIKGALVRALAESHFRGLTGGRGREYDEVAWDEPMNDPQREVIHDALQNLVDDRSDPEFHTFRAELRRCAQRAFAALSSLERDVVVGIHLLDNKVAAFARSIGYSRGHISMVRRDAFQKIRSLYQPFRSAA